MDTMVRKEDYDLECIRAMADIAMEEILNDEDVSNITWAYSTLMSSLLIYKQNEYNDKDELCDFLNKVSGELADPEHKNVLEFVKLVHSLISIYDEEFKKVFVTINKRKASVKIES